MEYFRLFLSALVTTIVDILSPIGRRKLPKLLVVKLDHLGDVVTATPVFRELREAYPDARIDALVGSWAQGLLSGNPFLDRILIYDSTLFSRSEGSRRGFRQRFRQMRAIAAHRYTHIIELRGDSWTLLLPFLSGTTRRVDRGTVRLESWLTRHMWAFGGAPPAPDPVHEVETNLVVIQPLLGLNGPQPLPTTDSNRVEVFVTDPDRLALAMRTRALGIPDDAPLVVIHPGASWRPRAWRPERFAEVARELLDRYPVHVCFVGATEDADIADRIAILVQDRRAHFLFELRLVETATLIERSVLFLGSDSGIVHLAAACGTPVIALYGPQDPRRFRPWSDRAIVHHKPVPCFPCKQKVCVVPHNPCVNLIYVEDVMRSAESVLGPPVEARTIS
jgi:lipopolysaccharide heptosyltransferase II